MMYDLWVFVHADGLHVVRHVPTLSDAPLRWHLRYVWSCMFSLLLGDGVSFDTPSYHVQRIASELECVTNREVELVGILVTRNEGISSTYLQEMFVTEYRQQEIDSRTYCEMI